MSRERGTAMPLKVLATGARQAGFALFAAALLCTHPAWSKGAASSGKPAEAQAPSVPKNAAGVGTASEGSKPTEADASEANPAPDVWSDQEIAEAKAYCDQILHGVEAVIEPADPIKEGECGAPAPVRLLSIGRNPEVTLSPPVTVTCDLVVRLAEWLKDDLQPLARKHLGGEIVRVNTMSSYSCRNAYGRKKTKLSEHGRANAVDLGSFVTGDGVEADLLKGWGLTARDVQKIVARSKAAKTAALMANGQSGDPKPAPERNGKGQPALMVASMASMGSMVPLPIRKPPADVAQWQVQLKLRSGKGSIRPSPELPTRRPQAVAMNEASHLGGPEAEEADVAPEPFAPDDQVALFLRAAHTAACRRFGTVLGPEANEAHRNHFHLDMAKRKHSNYCE